MVSPATKSDLTRAVKMIIKHIKTSFDKHFRDVMEMIRKINKENLRTDRVFIEKLKEYDMRLKRLEERQFQN